MGRSGRIGGTADRSPETDDWMAELDRQSGRGEARRIRKETNPILLYSRSPKTIAQLVSLEFIRSSRR
jgi:hypothetical protein